MEQQGMTPQQQGMTPQQWQHLQMQAQMKQNMAKAGGGPQGNNLWDKISKVHDLSASWNFRNQLIISNQSQSSICTNNLSTPLLGMQGMSSPHPQQHPSGVPTLSGNHLADRGPSMGLSRGVEPSKNTKKVL